MDSINRVVKYKFDKVGVIEYTIMPYFVSSHKRVGRVGKKADEVSDEYIEKKIRRNKTLFRRICLANKLNRHIILTYKDKYVYCNDIDKADEQVKEFFKRLRKKYSELKYVATREFQERGVIHYHILINMYVPIEELNFAWNGIKKVSLKGMEKEEKFRGWVSVVCHKDTMKAINYVAKYLMKEIENMRMETKNGYSKKMYLSSKGLKQAVEDAKESIVVHEDSEHNKIVQNEISWFMTNCDLVWDLEFEAEFPGIDDNIKIKSILLRKRGMFNVYADN